MLDAFFCILITAIACMKTSSSFISVERNTNSFTAAVGRLRKYFPMSNVINGCCVGNGNQSKQEFGSGDGISSVLPSSLQTEND